MASDQLQPHAFTAKPFNSTECNECDLGKMAVANGVVVHPDPETAYDAASNLVDSWYEPHLFQKTVGFFDKCQVCHTGNLSQYHIRDEVPTDIGPHVEQITRETLTTEVPTDKLKRMVLNAYEMYPGDIGLEGESSADVETARRVNDLRDWWLALQAKQIDMVATKAVEYGSNSLEQLGSKLARLQRRRPEPEELQELGCWINAVQKMERWTDAVYKGKRPSDDTLIDLMVYCVMALRLREVGGWPDASGL